VLPDAITFVAFSDRKKTSLPKVSLLITLCFSSWRALRLCVFAGNFTFDIFNAAKNVSRKAREGAKYAKKNFMINLKKHGIEKKIKNFYFFPQKCFSPLVIIYEIAEKGFPITGKT
jgi:hypothetical protein